ncbi:MAG: DUF445 family protein [Spirochaetia bacterium]
MNISFTDLTILQWAVPPLIGALIGYVTNVIAIRMLFRPLKVKKILGISLPLTPGIIPRQRHSLAESIGVMVSRDLITEDAVRSQLESPSFSMVVQKKFKALMDLLLYSPTKELPKKLKLTEIGFRSTTDTPEYEKGPTESLVNAVLVDFFRTEGFRSSIRKTVLYSVEPLFRLPVHRVLGNDGERILSLLSPERIERVREPVKLNFRIWLRTQINMERQFSSFLTPQIINGIGNMLEHLYPSLFEAFLEYLRAPQVHKKLELRGKVVLRRILDKLSSFQRFFVLAGQYDRTIDERMDVVVDDVLKQLEKAGWDYETKERLFDMLREWLNRVAQKNARELQDAWRGNMLEDLSSAIDSLFDWLGSERGLEVARGVGESLFRRVSDVELGTAIYRLLGIEKELISATLADWVVEMVGTDADSSKEESPQIWTLLRSMAGEISSDGRKSIAEILGLSEVDKDKMEAEATRLFLKVLNEQVPLILESVDVRTLVVEKIDTLDIEKVEDLILQVIRSHLRWISAFGAILGFLIGGIQVLFFFFSMN